MGGGRTECSWIPPLLLLFSSSQSVLYTFGTIIERMDADKKECLQREKVSERKNEGRERARARS